MFTWHLKSCFCCSCTFLLIIFVLKFFLSCYLERNGLSFSFLTKTVLEGDMVFSENVIMSHVQ